MAASWFGREARTAATITYGIWALVWLTYLLTEPIAGAPVPLAQLPFEIAQMLVVATVAFALYPLTRCTTGWPPAARWTFLIAAVALVALVQTGVNLSEKRLVGDIPAFDAAHASLIRQLFVRSLRVQIYICGANFAALAVLVELRRSAAAELRAARAEAAAEHARLVALRLQLNPHFLFNALNALSSLVVLGRTAQAEEMLERLVDFLRASLAADPDAMVPLEEEAAAIEAYLAIEAVRFGERLVVEIDTPADLAHAAVPSFILQPLVENAVKYGVARSRVPVTVRLRAAVEGACLVLSVDDDGAELPPPPPRPRPRDGMGLGLANVRQRLRALYGDGASFEKRRVDGRFTATLRIPLRAT